tara:strand:+ start:15 stop:512 length:498 start_codon:yes stop_codon:yes gene_type:complete
MSDNSDCSSNKLVSLDFLDREAMLYKQSKESLKTNSEIIDKVIKKNTEKEVEEVQCAIKKLNEKMDAIMQTDFVKEKQTAIEASQEQMSNSIKKAYDAYFKVRTYILEKEGLTDEQKQVYIKKLYHKIIDKFMTAEEKAMFERLVSGGGIFIMNNGSSGIRQLIN